MKRYHPVLVVLHWLIALMILVALFIGGPGLVKMQNDDPAKLFALTGHMIWGLSIGVFMVLRLVTRLRSQKPPHADTGNQALNIGAKIVHSSLYILVFALVGSGLGIAVSADLFEVVFGNSNRSLPDDFNVFTARQLHGAITTLLMILIAFHFAGWMFHQFVLRDGLIGRMWFGKRN